MIEQLGGYFAQIRACMESGDIEKIKPVFVRVKEIIIFRNRPGRNWKANWPNRKKNSRRS